jgi:hypothetical protein
MALTDTKVRSLKSKSAPYKVSDGEGLYVLVPSNDSKLWRLAYRYLGKQKTLALGQYPTVTLLEARRARDEAKRTFTTLAAGHYDGWRTERLLSRPPKSTAMAHQLSLTRLARFNWLLRGSYGCSDCSQPIEETCSNRPISRVLTCEKYELVVAD